MSEARDQNKFLVRMPDGMRDRIADAAKANNRSMNSEIIARLEATFEQPTDFSKVGLSEAQFKLLQQTMIETVKETIREDSR